MRNVTLDMLYEELRRLHKDVEVLKSAVIPVEKVSASRLAELRRIATAMDEGKKHSVSEVFGR